MSEAQALRSLPPALGRMIACLLWFVSVVHAWMKRCAVVKNAKQTKYVEMVFAHQMVILVVHHGVIRLRCVEAGSVSKKETRAVIKPVLLMSNVKATSVSPVANNVARYGAKSTKNVSKALVSLAAKNAAMIIATQMRFAARVLVHRMGNHAVIPGVTKTKSAAMILAENPVSLAGIRSALQQKYVKTRNVKHLRNYAVMSHARGIRSALMNHVTNLAIAAI